MVAPVKETPLSKFRSAARTDTGMKREHNEDSWLVNEDIGLYVVCDGMGGHAGGETASRLAVQTVERELIGARMRDNPFASAAPLSDTPLAGALREAIEGACAAVFRTSRANPELQGMGTTCIALLLHGGTAILGHVGDSRAYAMRDGRLKNIITRSVGFEEDVLVDLLGFETAPGDRYLLCSDGLSNLVDNEEIATQLLRHEDPERACRALIDLANERGGDDNVT